MTQKLLHISDSLINAEQYDTDEETPFGGVSLAIDHAIEAKIDAVVHSGNLFRRPTPNSKLRNAVQTELERLQSADIEFLAVKGPREQTDSDTTFSMLVDQGYIHHLSSSPTTFGDIAIFGIDHVETEDELHGALNSLSPADSFTGNVVVANQEIWPPGWEETAEMSSYDFLDSTDVFVNLVLAGGIDDPREWESDDYDYSVLYSGTSNPAEVSQGTNVKTTLVKIGTDTVNYERKRLVTTSPADEINDLREALGFQPSETADLDIETLIDLYGLSAKAKKVFEDRRKEIRDELLERLDSDGEFGGNYATISKQTYDRSQVKSEDEVLSILEQNGIDSSEVMKIDTSSLRDTVENESVPESAVFDFSENSRVQLEGLEL